MRVPGWEFVTSIVFGVAAGAYLRADVFKEASGEIVTILGFIMAALVPAMALAATALRPGTFSIIQIRALGSAIDRQIRIFGGLFLYALAACMIVVVGKVSGWSLPPLIVPKELLDPISLNAAFPSSITFFLSLLVLRSGAFISGVLSILRLSIATAEDEARARTAAKSQTVEDELAGYEMPAGYASLIKTSHH